MNQINNNSPLANAPPSEGISFQDVLNYGIMTPDDLQNLQTMLIQKRVLEKHRYKVYQGKDGRYYTYVSDPSYSTGRHKLVKRTETELYSALYAHYFERGMIDPTTRSLTIIYPEWLKYKISTANRMNTIRRIDTDYHKYYVNEPLSLPIMTTPLLELTRAQIKQWMYGLIKKYNLNQRAFYNATTILRQVYDYMIECELTEKNPCRLIKIPSSAFRKDRKKPAETQIFYADEVKAIIDYCFLHAEEEQALVFYVIPLFFYTGIRIGECLGISFNDCNYNLHTINIHQSLVVHEELLPDGSWGKRTYQIEDYLKGNGESRDILVTDQCFDLIKKIRKMQMLTNQNSEYLFPNITEAMVQRRLYTACKKLGLTARSPHKWRKTYISMLLNNGVDPDFVRTQVGHKELSTTLNSYDFSTTRKERHIEQLSAILG